MTPAIRVEGLGKKYRISHRTAKGYRTLREDLLNTIQSASRRIFRGDFSGTEAEEDFWAVPERRSPPRHTRQRVRRTTASIGEK
jgi:hypothetical protein